MGARMFAGWGVLTIALVSARADAETVKLADGSVYVGELVEKVPSDHITIRLATGDIRRFEWSALAVTAQAPPVMTVATSAPITTPAPPAHVEVVSDSKGALLMKVEMLPIPTTNPNGNVFHAFTERVVPVCYPPCSADVDSSAAYFIEGAYVSSTRRFAIPAGASKLTIRTGSSTVSAVGGWTLAFGIMSVIFGAIDTPVAFVNATGPWNGWQYVGVTTLIGGGVLMALGIPLIVAGLTHASIGDIDVAHRNRVRWNGALLAF